MTTFTQLAPEPSDPPEPFTDRLRLAVAAYLARFKGFSREHTDSDLRTTLHPYRGVTDQLAERWSAELAMHKLRRSAHHSVTKLEADIRKLINEWVREPKAIRVDQDR